MYCIVCPPFNVGRAEALGSRMLRPSSVYSFGLIVVITISCSGVPSLKNEPWA
jgi:hypothetical protein